MIFSLGDHMIRYSSSRFFQIIRIYFSEALQAQHDETQLINSLSMVCVSTDQQVNPSDISVCKNSTEAKTNR